MHSNRSRLLFLAVALFAAATPVVAASAQSRDDSDADWLDNCRSSRRYSNSDERGRACEVRNVPVKLSGRFISIDGRQNGGISVHGWDGNEVKVTARVQAQDRSDASAADLLQRVRVSADERSVRADGPSMDGEDGRSWSVSFVVFVPRRFDLDLQAHNGGVSVTGVTGKLELATVNGGLALDDIGGDVHAHTNNGGLNVKLTGSRWNGAGLDAETHNGGVRLAIPENYSAQLETGTVNGHVNTDFPVTVRGDISRHMSFPIGGGGPTIRATTTNGSVLIARR